MYIWVGHVRVWVYLSRMCAVLSGWCVRERERVLKWYVYVKDYIGKSVWNVSESGQVCM